MRPLNDKLIVQKDVEEKEQISAGGIIMNKTEDKRPATGKVLSVGEKIADIQADETVVFPKFAGVNVELDDGNTVLVLAREEVLMVI